ncbi:reverse transcriptase [Senna tora]|uniref:Reverse transcriptase n=1 Tax=Senna tora TaxID=362788 RepID=A0A834WS23_9FABA|nr:reverse transcriptase [Senna tora]
MTRCLTRSSFIKKSINKGKDLLDNGLTWRVGNGLKINFWHDSWLPSGPIRQQIEGPLNFLEDNLTVKDYTQTSRTWPPSTSLTLPPSVFSEIQSTFFSIDQNDEDILIWNHSKDGQFTVKSAYASISVASNLKSTTNIMHNMNWIWKPFCNPRQSFFLWRSYHLALPTSQKLNAIIPTIPPTFKLSLSKAIEYHFLVISKSPGTHRVNQIVKWKEPQESYYKLNFDGSASNHHLGAGGIIRDDQGRHFASFCQFVGKGDSLKAEF